MVSMESHQVSEAEVRDVSQALRIRDTKDGVGRTERRSQDAGLDGKA